MENKKVLLILVLALAVLLAGASLLYPQLSQGMEGNQLSVQDPPKQTQTTAPAGTEPTDPAGTEPADPDRTKAPDFLVYDGEGNQVRLSDFFGKPIVLNFWASWCGPCKMEMPDFNEKYLEIGDEVQFLMINATGGRETPASAKEFLASTDYTFPVFFDMAQEASAVYGIYSLPTTYFIDAEGYLVARAMGAIPAETLQRGIDMITGK